MKSRISRLASTGWRPGIMWSAPSTTTSGAPVSSASRCDRGDGLAGVLGAVDEEHRTADGAAGRLDRRQVRDPGSTLDVGDHRVDRAVERPLDGVLDLLGRMRLGRDLLEEEPREARVVAPAK